MVAGLGLFAYWLKMPDNSAACVVSFKEQIIPIVTLLSAICLEVMGCAGLLITLKSKGGEN